MRDPFILSLKLKSDPIIYVNAYSGIDGQEKCQEFANYQKECFILAVGAEAFKYSSLAAKLAAEAAAWGYKVIRTRMSGVGKSSVLIKRIFRSVNLRLWQKHKEVELTDLVVASLGVVLLSRQTFWVGTAGAIWVYLLRGGNLTRLNSPDVNEEKQVTKALGLQKPVLIPQITNEKLKPGDTIILASGDLIQIIRDSKLTKVFGNMGKVNQEDLDIKVSEVLAEVDSKQSGMEMSLTVIHHQELYYK